MPITREDIFAAADQITANGQVPTLARVRDITKGSFTTIQPALKAWKELHREAELALREPVPSAVREQLTQVGADIWALAIGQANKRLTDEQANFKRNLEEAQQNLSETVELADRLSDELGELKARLTAMEADKQAANARLVDKEKEYATLSQTLEQTQHAARTAAAQAQDALQAAEGQLNTLRQEHATELNQARKEATTAREEATRWYGQVEALQAQVKELLRVLGPQQGKLSLG
jgi:chromosome segregation ATPase